MNGSIKTGYGRFTDLNVNPLSNHNSNKKLSKNRNYKSNNYRSIKKKYNYRKNTKGNIGVTKKTLVNSTKSRNNIGFFDKETEKIMTEKDYPGPLQYYNDLVNEGNYVYQNGKLVKDNYTHNFKFTPPCSSETTINYRPNNKRFNNKRSNNKRSNNKKSNNKKSNNKKSNNKKSNNKISQNTFYPLNNNFENYLENNNQLIGGGLHWDNLNPQKIYMSNETIPGPISPGEINNERYGENAGHAMPGVSTAQIYSNSDGFGFAHADMVCFAGCHRHDAAADGPSDDNPFHAKFFQMLACGGIINKVPSIVGVTRHNLLFMERPRGCCYSMSHFISRDAWRPRAWLEGKTSWLNTYVKWQLRTCICVMVTSFTMGPEVWWSRRDVQGHTFFRYMFDLNNAKFLASAELRHLWGDPTDRNIQNNPWAYMCQQDLDRGLSDFPVSNEGDVVCKDAIASVWRNFLDTYWHFDNYLDQYLYLWWLAGSCMGTYNFGGDEKYSRLEIFMYRYPWGSTGEHGQTEPMGLCQITRFLSLIQKPYINSIPFYGPGSEVNPNTIFPMNEITPELEIQIRERPGLVLTPHILHLRDGHASAASSQSQIFENEWQGGTFRYMIATNPLYCAGWHERRAGWLAGIFSGKKCANELTIMPVAFWKQTFGRALAWHQNGGNPYLTICPSRAMGGSRDDPHDGIAYNKQGQWGYGLEEFVGGWMMMTQGKAGWEPGADDWVRNIYCNTLWVGSISWLQNISAPDGAEAWKIADMSRYYRYRVWDYNKSFNQNIEDQRLASGVGSGTCPVQKSWILVFYQMYNSLCKLAFDFAFHYIRWKDNVHDVTWGQVRKRLFKIKKDFTIAIADPVKLYEFKTNKNGEINHSFDEPFVRFLVLIFPPVYAFLTTLFSNSSSQHHFMDPQYGPNRYSNFQEVIQTIDTIRNNAMNFSEDANTIYNSQRLNSIYQLQGMHPLKLELQKNLQNGFDLREWYAPEIQIKLQWRDTNLAGQHKPNWYFIALVQGEEKYVTLFTDLAQYRNERPRQNCSDVW